MLLKCKYLLNDIFQLRENFSSLARRHLDKDINQCSSNGIVLAGISSEQLTLTSIVN